MAIVHPRPGPLAPCASRLPVRALAFGPNAGASHGIILAYVPAPILVHSLLQYLMVDIPGLLGYTVRGLTSRPLNRSIAASKCNAPSSVCAQSTSLTAAIHEGENSQGMRT